MSSIMGRRRDSVTSSSHSQAAAATTSVQVAVRIRPVTSADQSSIPARWQRNVINTTSNNSLQVEQGAAPPPASGGAPASTSSSSREKKQAFSFDRVLSPADGQSQVFSVAEPLIQRFLEGYNATILAYGQTSSGKSYTMGTAAGDDVDYEALVQGRSPDPQMGIIPRAVAQIFSTIKHLQTAKSGSVQYNAKVSFIEIYNEDLIDLLADADGDARPHVQIREGKNGSIIWSGLREFRVNNVAQVMNYLLQGSSVRRTNETDMNAQSSRSHAIFSLTLTQRKFVGSPPTPTSSSSSHHLSHPPSAFGGRTTPLGIVGGGGGGRVASSGLPRPMSSIPSPSGIDRSRVNTPSISRPHTPSGSGIPALGGRQSSGGLRPSSSLSGPRSASPMPGTNADDATSKAAGSGGDGEWVTVTSKFHFVDLAGSERLKRTAAQGERVKEGISINSGLHALGNVISALGDPSKAKRTTHIPYRDSKLTRLLQDSLGGNAHTLMIACVSPTEYNVSETLNTLQYANRARNIKNKAELNEVEVGWDDLDYLQTLVQKLRKELSIIKGNATKTGSVDLSGGKLAGPDAARAAQNEILQWQEKYASLSQKHTHLTTQVTKLRAQLDPKKHGQEDDDDDFFKSAEPIIVEYEKSIDALEGQLNITKAALAYVEDLANDRELVINDQTRKLQDVESELETKQTAIAELQTRITKLHERESSADVYARELEGRLEAFTSRDDSESTVMADLRKEISRLKESERNTEQYVKDLEAKLATADEATASLEGKVSLLEAETERRAEEYKNLLARFEFLDSEQETKHLASQLEARDQRLHELEEKLASVVDEKENLAQQHALLSDQVAAHEIEKSQVDERIKVLESAAAADSSFTNSDGNQPTRQGKEETAEKYNQEDTLFHDRTKVLEEQFQNLQAEMIALKDAESKLRSDLETTNLKYRQALTEINDLNTRLTEAKLTGVAAPSTPGHHHEVSEDELEVLAPPASQDNPSRTPLRTNSRRSSMRRPESLLIDTTNRQTPGSGGRLSRRSSASFLGYNKSDAPAIRAPSPSSSHTRTRSMSQSFQQELLASLSPSRSPLSTRGPRPLSLSGSVPPSPTFKTFEPDSPAKYERKVLSLEKEAMRLQEVLRERDDEVQALEVRLREIQARPPPAIMNGAAHTPPSSSPVGVASTPPNGKNGLLLSPDRSLEEMSTDGISSQTAPTPVTEKEYDAVRQLLAEARLEDELGNPVNGESITRLDDLMRSMARKETDHRDKMETATEELNSLRKQHETLQALSRDQVANMSNEIEQLRAQLQQAKIFATTAPVPTSSDPTVVLSAPSLHDQPIQTLPREPVSSDALHADLGVKHSVAAAEKTTLLQAELQSAHESHAVILAQHDAEHQKALEELGTQNEEAMTRKVQELEAAVQRKAEDHQLALTLLKEENQRQLKVQAEQHAAALSNAELAQKSSNTDSESDRAVLLQQLQQDHQAQLSKLKEDHEVSLVKALEAQDVGHQSVLADEVAKWTNRESESKVLIEAKQQEHARAVERQTKEHAAQVQAIKVHHEKSFEELQMELEAQHLSALSKALGETESKAQAELEAAHQAARETRATEMEQLNQKHATTLEETELKYQKLVTSHAEELGRINQGHDESSLQANAALVQLQTRHEDLQKQLVSLQEEHSARQEALTNQHQTFMEALQAEHSAKLERALFDVQIASADREELRKVYEELETKHREYMEKLDFDPHEIDTLRAELIETSDALVTLEAALTEAQEDRDQLLIEIETIHQSWGNPLQTAQAAARVNGDDTAPAGHSTVVDSTLQRELETHKTTLSKIKSELQTALDERTKQEQTIKELQLKLLATSETRSIRSTASGSFGGLTQIDTEVGNVPASPNLNGPKSPVHKRISDYEPPVIDLRNHRPSLGGAGKPPPPTPPPNMPPPPTPVGPSVAGSSSNNSSMIRSSAGIRTSTSSQITRPESPGMMTRSSSVASMHSPSINGIHTADAKLTKLLSEQAEEIKNLAKQLNHCEADLQANIDLVATLEAALNDSERNLRKSRVQLAEVTRERDRYSAQADEMRSQLNSAQHEVESVRNSVLLEKQGYENKIEEERQAKERARKALEARLEEVSRRKNGKLFCL